MTPIPKPLGANFGLASRYSKLAKVSAVETFRNEFGGFKVGKELVLLGSRNSARHWNFVFKLSILRGRLVARRSDRLRARYLHLRPLRAIATW